MRRTIAGALPLLAAALLGCGPAEPELSLIWISLDTLRADHLGLYGYARDTSPFLDELAERSLVFDWAISPQSSTLPTHISMFTGYHPFVHGVMHSAAQPGVHLADSVRTLPQILRDAGLRTRAWVDGGKLRGHFGFAKGFESYDDAPGPLPGKLDAALAALDAGDAGRRFFYLIHSYEIHGPYDPPPPYDRRYRTPSPGPGEAERDGYDGSIRFADDELRRFAAALEARGLLDSTILAITSDHGESFAEYGSEEIGHLGPPLRQNLTRVPWLVRHPDPRRRGRIGALVGLVDFPNTMLTLLGVDERAPGGGRNALEPEPGAGYLSWAGGGWSLYADGYHLLASDGEADSLRNGLFHVARDPRETRAVDDPVTLAALRSRFEAQRRELERLREALQPSLRGFRRLPARTREELRALGYAVDGADPTAD